MLHFLKFLSPVVLFLAIYIHTCLGNSVPTGSIDVMDKNSRIVIVGAGVFGLSTAAKLASEGYKYVTVVDRHMPPVKFSFLLFTIPCLTRSGSGWLQLGYFPCYPFRLRRRRLSQHCIRSIPEMVSITEISRHLLQSTFHSYWQHHCTWSGLD